MPAPGRLGLLAAAVALAWALGVGGVATTTRPAYERLTRPTPTPSPGPTAEPPRFPAATRFVRRLPTPTLPPGQQRYPSIEAAQAEVPFAIARPATWRYGPLVAVIVMRDPAGNVTLVQQRYAVPMVDGVDLPITVFVYQWPAGAAGAPVPAEGVEARPFELRRRPIGPVPATEVLRPGERWLVWTESATRFAVAAPDLLELRDLRALAEDLAR